MNFAWFIPPKSNPTSRRMPRKKAGIPLTARLPARANKATPAWASTRSRTGRLQTSAQSPTIIEPRAIPRRKTLSMALNE